MFAVMEISQGDKSLGKIKIKLFNAEAPLTVENFAGLAEGSKEFTDPKTHEPVKRPFYDGLTFHRVIDGFMIQGGDPVGNGTGGPGYTFDDEINPRLTHDKPGILSMANAGKDAEGNGTNGSQFFITLVPTNYLNGKHTVFGEVVEGMDVVKKIGSTPTGPNDRPLTPVIMKSVKIIRK
jgi:peptidyl-prolyl cis-trans isomerase A (cyclophilin A)